MLEFDLKGLLTPAQIILSDIVELENEFVFKFDSLIRADLFEKYKLYTEALQIACENYPLKQWIDGSFVTKKLNPSDIDLITFIDYEVAKREKGKLKSFIYPNSLELYGVDAYFIIVYPETHPLHYITQSDSSYWIDIFGKTKPNRRYKRIAKGFLEINV